MTVSAAWGPIGITNTTLAATSYEWNFGDGQTATTQSPTVTHDYKSAIQAEKIAHSFDVTCTVVHDNLTVKRTLVLHSAYGMCRRLGLIVPPVTGDTYATFQRVAFSGSMVIRNLESGTITLKSMACIPISDDVSVALPSPQFKAMERPIAIAENSFAGLGVYIPLSQLQAEGGVGPSTTGFTVYYSGSLLLTDGSSMPVRFSHTFRIPLTYAGVVNKWLSFPVDVSKWDISGALSAVSGVSARSVLSTSGTQILDPATNTVSIPLASSAPSPSVLAAVGIAVQSGLTKIAMSAGAIGETGVPVHVAATAKVAETVTIRPMDVTIDPDNPPPVVEGQPCYPDDISDTDAATAAAQQLVCQLTDVTETVTIPSPFQNALQGDVILSPGGDGAGQTIAGLLRALPHPQYHSHSGIMTRNFFEITHCTAEEKRYSNQNNMVKLDGAVPFMLGPDVLQYGWPGSITQTIDDATSGQQSWKDPGGTKYQIGGFTPDALGIQFDGFQVVSPLVIKPLPENEINFRPRLRQVADTARSKGATADANGNVTYQKGGCYYSFYCYTDPQISKGFTDQAGPDAGWAQGMSPAVCSSFVWLCMKENKIPLVTSNQYESASDLTLASVADGAAVGTATLDGLFYYSASARQEAGQALYQILQNTVEDQEPGILQNIPGLNSEFAGAIADQILNDFAYGDPTMWNSSAWQNTGDANAVSPDNIEWWKAPCFGYLEPLQYLPQHTEQYTVSQWTKVITWGTVSGVVTLQGHPVAGAYVYVYDGNDATTDASGHYMLNKVPVGSYAIKASAVENNFEYSNGLSGQTVTLTASNPNLTYDISLAGLPQSYRRLDATYSISCDHGDLNPGHTHGVQTDGPNSQSAFVNPGQLTSGFTYTFDYNGGGYFHIDYVFSVALLLDYSIEVTIDATMYDDGNNYQVSNTLGPFNFRMDGAYSGWINLENSNGYHDGPAQFTFTAWNNQQTG